MAHNVLRSPVQNPTGELIHSPGFLLERCFDFRIQTLALCENRFEAAHDATNINVRIKKNIIPIEIYLIFRLT